MNMNNSVRVYEENPWNEYLNDICDGRNNRINDLNAENSNVVHNGEGMSRRSFVRLWKPKPLLLCKICDKIIVNSSFFYHYESCHFQSLDPELVEEFGQEQVKHQRCKRVKRNKKRRAKLKVEVSQRNGILEGDASQKHYNFQDKGKINTNGTGSGSKRSHSLSVFRDDIAANKKRKMDKMICDNLIFDDNAGLIDDIGFYNQPCDEDDEDDNHLKPIFNEGVSSFNDVAYSNIDSVNRISSDSSTPPSISLGGGSSTLHTLSSPGGSLHVNNDAASSTTAISEHYHLPSSSDLTPDRSTSCKYQIESLPWENLPLPLSETPPPANKSSAATVIINNELEEDGNEIERAVQSITAGLCNGNGNNDNLSLCSSLNSQQIINGVDNTNEGSNTMISASLTYRDLFCNPLLNPTNKPLHNITTTYIGANSTNPSIANSSGVTVSDDISIIDSFLDEIVSQQYINDPNTSRSSSSSLQLSQMQSNSHHIITLNTANNSLDSNEVDDSNSYSDYPNDQNNAIFNNNFTSDYDEKLEALINSALCDLVTQSPNNSQTYIPNTTSNIKKNYTKSNTKSFDPLKHCGVLDSLGNMCFRGLMCKHHTMPQKRLVERPESITALIKAKKMKRKSTPVSSTDTKPSSVQSVMDGASNCDASSLQNNVQQNSPAKKSFLDNYKPLIDSYKFNGEVLVQGQKSYIALKSLLWKRATKAEVLLSQDLIDKKVSENNSSSKGSSLEFNSTGNDNVTLIKQSTINYVNSENTITSTADIVNSGVSNSGFIGGMKCEESRTKTNQMIDETNVQISPATSTEIGTSTMGINTGLTTTLPMAHQYQQQMYTAPTYIRNYLYPQQPQLIYPISTGGVGMSNTAATGGRIFMLMNSLPMGGMDISSGSTIMEGQHLQQQQTTGETVPLPLTVQSNMPGGLTQRFVILPDGTIASGTGTTSQHTGNNANHQHSGQLLNQQIFLGGSQEVGSGGTGAGSKIILTAAPPPLSQQHQPRQHFIMPAATAQQFFQSHQNPQNHAGAQNTGAFLIASPAGTNTHNGVSTGISGTNGVITCSSFKQPVFLPTTQAGYNHQQQMHQTYTIPEPYSADSSIVTIDSQSSTPVKSGEKLVDCTEVSNAGSNGTMVTPPGSLGSQAARQQHQITASSVVLPPFSMQQQQQQQSICNITSSNTAVATTDLINQQHIITTANNLYKPQPPTLVISPHFLQHQQSISSHINQRQQNLNSTSIFSSNFSNPSFNLGSNAQHHTLQLPSNVASVVAPSTLRSSNGSGTASQKTAQIQIDESQINNEFVIMQSVIT